MTDLNAQSLRTASPTTLVPQYPRDQVSIGIVHFGVGGFHRAHQAVYLDSLIAIDPDARTFGLCGVSLLPQDRRIVDVLTGQDTLYTLLTRHRDGRTDARIVGSIIDHRFAPDDPDAVLQLLTDPQVRIVTLTITEGGYFSLLGDDAGVDLDASDLVHDAEHPGDPRTAFGYILEALRRRRAAEVPPFTVLSCDNAHTNGELTRRVITALADRVDTELAAWVADHVAFPNSMVDRITPRTTDGDLTDAEALTGLSDGWPVPTEAFSQWVIEDRFPTGRPAWEAVGAQLVDDVRPYELMKTRLLNAGHQTIAYTGRLLGYTYAHEALNDPTIARLVRHYQEKEGARTLPRIPGTDFDTYSAAVRERFSNPQIHDSLERLTDQSSTMLSTYLLPVIRELLDADRDASAAIAVVACWAHFLNGVDDNGQAYAVTDRRGLDLQARAGRHDSDLLAVIIDNPLFVGLNDRRAFRDLYRATLECIRAEGVRVALNRALDHHLANMPGNS